MDFGQAIITAAFVDDILSLIIFLIFLNEITVVKTVIFPIVAIILMILAMVAAVKVWPKVINEMLLPRAPLRRDPEATGLKRFRLTQDECLFIVQVAMLIAYSYITYVLGTHLWGCF